MQHGHPIRRIKRHTVPFNTRLLIAMDGAGQEMLSARLSRVEVLSVQMVTGLVRSCNAWQRLPASLLYRDEDT